jgi:hypothetical protein
LKTLIVEYSTVFLAFWTKFVDVFLRPYFSFHFALEMVGEKSPKPGKTGAGHDSTSPMHSGSTHSRSSVGADSGPLFGSSDESSFSIMAPIYAPSGSDVHRKMGAGRLVREI